MVIAVTFQFQEQGDQVGGWSETYFSSAGTIASAYNQAAALGALRCNCLAGTIFMPWTRLVPQPIGSGIPVLINNDTDPNFQNVGQLNATAGFAVQKGLLRLVATTNQSTRQPFGGIPVGNFGPNGTFKQGGIFKTAFTAFLAGLNNYGFCIRKVNNPTPTPPNQGGYFKQPIMSISNAGVLSCPNNGLPLGALVYVGRTAQGYGVRGFWKVASNDGTNVTLQGFAPSKTPIPNTKTQYIQLYSYLYPSIILNPTNPTNPALTNAIIRTSKHAVGRPKNPSTGRRRRPVR